MEIGNICSQYALTICGKIRLVFFRTRGKTISVVIVSGGHAQSTFTLGIALETVSFEAVATVDAKDVWSLGWAYIVAHAIVEVGPSCTCKALLHVTSGAGSSTLPTGVVSAIIVVATTAASQTLLALQKVPTVAPTTTS